MVSIILGYLKAGESTAAIIKQYPALKEDDVVLLCRMPLGWRMKKSCSRYIRK
jgi:hypothetical protein